MSENNPSTPPPTEPKIEVDEKLLLNQTLDEIRAVRTELANHANNVLPPLTVSDTLPPSVQETIRQEYLKRADTLPEEQRRGVDQANTAHDETEKWDRYLTDQENLDTQYVRLQDKLDMSRKTRAGYSASEATPSNKGQMTREINELEKECADFIVANIPEVMWGDYRLPSDKIVEKKHLIVETPEETPVNDFLKKQEDWREVALSRQKTEENESKKQILDLKRQRDAALEDVRRLREEAMKIKAEEERATNSQGEFVAPPPIKTAEEIRAENQTGEFTPPPSVENLPEPQNDLRTRLRSMSDYLLGGGLGVAAALSGGVISTEILTQIDPVIAFNAGEYLATSVIFAANALAERAREFGNNHPHLLRIIRGASGGALATSIATTTASALEAAGIINVIPTWPNGAEQVVAQVTQPSANVATVISQNGEALKFPPVQEGQNLSTIVKDFLHLSNPQEIYRHTVETILGNLDKLPADKVNAISGLTTEQVMHDSKLFKLVMDAGRIIQPGQVFSIK